MNTLAEVIAHRTVQQLKSLLAWLPDAPRTGKKEELIRAILQSLSGVGLRAVWDRLDDTQRLAVAETMHAPDGLFNPAQFEAKYGRLPDFTLKQEERYGFSHGPPTPLNLFLHRDEDGYSVPVDIRERLEAFVPEPDPVRLDTVETLPETCGDYPLMVRHSERNIASN